MPRASSRMPPAGDNLEAAERAHQAVLCAVAQIEATRCRLLLDVRLLAYTAPLGEFHERIEALCVGGGSLFEVLSQLRAEADSDPAGSLSA